MNANWNLPALTSSYANFLAEMKSRDEDLAIWFENTTSTNLPVGAKKWNSTGNKFEEWSGTAWSDLSTLYEIKVRDSDKLNGQPALYYAVSSHDHTAASTTANGFMSFTDKLKLNEIAENANNYSHPTSDGNLHVPANGIANNGKFLQATAVAGNYVWASLPSTSLSTLGINATASELNFMDGVTSSVQSQLDSKQSVLQSGVSIKTINNTSILGSGDITINTPPTSSAVGAAIAGQSSGDIGTYAFLIQKVATATMITAGSNFAGSNFYYSGLYESGGYAISTNNTTSPAGTWKAMSTPYSGTSTRRSGLFLRIA